MNKKHNFLSILSLMLVTTMMTGCVDSEKNKLDNRVADYWNYKINKEFDKAYEFLSPGWKSSEPQEAYQQRMVASKVNWTKASFNKKECSQPDLCKVFIDIEYEFNMRAGGNTLMKVPTTVSEKWIMKDNRWYQVPDKKKIR